jgi:hypothetical protein
VSDTPHAPDDANNPENRTPKGKGGRGKTGRAGAREAVALLLASGRTQESAASELQVDPRTIRRWLADPAFTARMNELRGMMLSVALGRLSESCGKAADALAGLVDSEDPDVKHRAAKAVLELVVKLRDAVTVEERLAEVERQLAGGRTDERERGTAAEGGGAGQGPAGPG